MELYKSINFHINFRQSNKTFFIFLVADENLPGRIDKIKKKKALQDYYYALMRMLSNSAFPARGRGFGGWDPPNEYSVVLPTQFFIEPFIFLVGVSTYLPLRLATEQLDSWCP